MKVCTKCGKTLPLENFRWKNKAAGRRHAQCKECQSQQEKLKYQERKEQILQRDYLYKERNQQYILMRKECGCQKCGEKRFYVLDFHHINPKEKKANINNLRVSCSLDTLEQEINKCVCLCSNCHREFHHLEKENNITIEEYLLQ